MTPDELEAAVQAADVPRVVELLRRASETERRAAAPRAHALQLRWAELAVDGGDALEAVKLALYGTATVSELRRARGRASWPPRRHEVDVLAGRPAEVVGPIVAWQLEQHWGFGYARSLVRDGIIPPPATDWYVFRMIDARGPARDVLANDPGLLDHEVWRLFEVEGTGEFSLAARDKYVPPQDSWQSALVDVAATSSAHRDRLLDASLDALARDFSTFRAGWFSRFHDALAPTPAERATRADRYSRLLRSQVKPTLALAIRALTVIEKDGRLDPDLVLGRIGWPLASAPTATSRAALKLLDAIAARHPDRRGTVAADVLEALAHASADVQIAALDLADRLVDGPDAELADRLQKHLSPLSASARPAATRLIERAGTVLPRSAAALPSHAPAHDARPTSQTDPSRRIVAVADIIELVHLLGSLLEDATRPDDVERALEGLARLGHTLDDERLVAPLRRRASTVLARRLGERQNTDLRVDLAALVLSWIDRELIVPPRLRPDVPTRRGGGFWLGPRATTYPARADRFLGLRLLRVAEASVRRRPLPLLSAPTHEGGWIAPTRLVERLVTMRPDEVDGLDLVAALLRLAPAGREEALAAAHGIPTEVGAALRHALGGTERVGPTAEYWAAAARARGPAEDDPAVMSRHPDLPPNAGRVARLDLLVGDRLEVPGGLDLVIDPPLVPDVLRDELPASTLPVSPFPGGVDAADDPGMSRWVHTIWPAGTEPWAAIGAVAIGRNLDWWSAQWTNRIYLEPFLQPWATLGPMARALLGLALGAKESGERGLAADVAIAAISDDRLDGAGLAGALSAAVALGLGRPRRWADSLASVSHISERHGDVVLDGAAGALAVERDAPPAELLPLVRLVRELVHAGRPLPLKAREALSRIPGRGALRRLADELLAASRAQ